MKKLILKLSKTESLKIVSDSRLNDKEVNYCCGEIIVYFIGNKSRFIIGQATVGDFFQAFIYKFKKVIHNKLQLHASINQNLGFMKNEYNNQSNHLSSHFVKILSPSGKSNHWVGFNYYLKSTYIDTKPMLATWLYNDKDGNIIFEVTPLYKWAFLPDDPEDQDFIIYEEFMKNYKPLITRVIPRDIAVAWLEQLMKVYRGLFKSEEEYQNMCKELGWENS